MEGVTDYPMRTLFSEHGGFTHFVSEFLRISQNLLPARVYFKHVPELKTHGRTLEGIRTQVQILGGDREKMASSAAYAVRLGSPGIDLNFGCPAPTVNRHDGGATLLKYPDRIFEIVRAVRAAVPPELPVSAKLRLGWDDPRAIHLNADRAAEGGASWITIHGRTRTQAYTPPAYWKPIGEVRRRLSIPVVANGEIWTREDFLRCQEETGCEHFMLGRGALADPNLPQIVSNELFGDGDPVAPLGGGVNDWLPLLRQFVICSDGFFDQPGYVVRRLKQWLRFAHRRGRIDWFDRIKRCENNDEFFEVLATLERTQTSASSLQTLKPLTTVPFVSVT